MWLPPTAQTFVAPAVSSIRPSYAVTVPSPAMVDRFGAPYAIGTTFPTFDPYGWGTNAALGMMAGWSVANFVAASAWWGLAPFHYGAPLYGVYW